MNTPQRRRCLIVTVLTLTGLATSLLLWQRPTLVRAQSKAGSTLMDARARLDQTKLDEKQTQTKDASRATEAALHDYNAAVEARVAEISARMRDISEVLVENTTLPFDVRGGFKTLNPKLLAEYKLLQAELETLAPGPLAPGNLNSRAEVEPNNTCLTATDLALGINESIVGTGSITAGDIDFWSFTAPAGSKVWGYVDTGGGQSSPINDRDSFLSLFDAGCGVLIEEDDDDGTGNGGDSATESGSASTIAGRTLAAAGTYTLAVRGFGPTSVISPYRLFVAITTGPGSTEIEPNNTLATANLMLGAAGTIAHRNGSITPAGDVDFHGVIANAGDVFFINGDGNPERDATNTDLIIDFVAPDGRSFMVPPADSGLGGSATNPEGEGFSIITPTAGTYGVRVSGFGTSTGTYSLMVARVNPVSICPVTEFTGILGQNSTQKPGISGIQNGRLNRFVDQTGACNNVRTCPGLLTAVGARPFDAYSFTNVGTTSACVTVQVDAQACLANNFLVVVAYLGPYDPANQCTNYLADIGGSPNPTGVFSFNVPASATFTLVVTAANPSPTVCATPYKVTVVGLPTFGTSIQDSVTGDTLQFNCFTGDYRFFSCATGTVVSGRGGCVSFGCSLTFGAGGGFKGGPATVFAQINTCTGTATATVTLNNGTTFNLSDTNTSDNSCFCP